MTSLLRAIALTAALLSPGAASAATISFSFGQTTNTLTGSPILLESIAGLPETPLADAVGLDIFRLNLRLIGLGQTEHRGGVSYRGSVFITNSLANALTLRFDASVLVSATLGTPQANGLLASTFDVISEPLPSGTGVVAGRTVTNFPSLGQSNVTEISNRQGEITLGAGQTHRINLSGRLGMDSVPPTGAKEAGIVSSLTFSSIDGLPSLPAPGPDPSVIPLPPTGLLLLSTLGGLAAFRRSRRQ